ncbi:MAG: class I mannose-6-phosphate isomerase [Oscillospiraceae bacterium]|nr:class I mannose-6-phosphate isomerase [Oscillospiraceae bacterium]
MSILPLKMAPAFQDYLWGGDQLNRVYHKNAPLDRVAESWELSCHKSGESRIGNGPSAGMTLSRYLEEHPEAAGSRYSGDFPVLVKFLDARQRLSLQVHPTEEYALRVEGEHGKTEMWYVVDCEPGAELIIGLSRTIEREEFLRRIEEHTILDVVGRYPVAPGDVYFIEAGTLHGIGDGILIAEIQQSSNATYRVYDYDRRDAEGKPRPLHTQKAADVTFLGPAREHPLPQFTHQGDSACRLIGECSYFQVKEYRLAGELSLEVGKESFLGLVCVGGEGELVHQGIRYPFCAAESYFLPAGLGNVTLEGKATLLSVEMP